MCRSRAKAYTVMIVPCAAAARPIQVCILERRAQLMLIELRPLVLA